MACTWACLPIASATAAPSAHRGSRRISEVMKSAGCPSHYPGRVLESGHTFVRTNDREVVVGDDNQP
jgi:hypothetical protein